MRYRKGQISFEFVISVLFVILVLSVILLTITDYVPQIESYNQRAEVNLESRQVTSMLMTSPGYHTFGSNGTDWEESENKIQAATEIGLASEYHVIEKDKLMALSNRGADVLNYSQFRELANIDNQYRFVFTVMPILNTHDKFIRTRPPVEPEIIEPENSEYNDAENLVGYGSIRMGGTQYNALTTSHDGAYDTLYIVDNSEDKWNFTNSKRYSEDEEISIDGRSFEVESFQNLGDERGNIVVLSRQLKTFGSAFDTSSSIIKLNRYATLKQPGAELHPLKIEVFSWAG